MATITKSNINTDQQNTYTTTYNYCIAYWPYIINKLLLSSLYKIIRVDGSLLSL
jgi:hypothetical protein